jgi:proline-specific peptidase
VEELIGVGDAQLWTVRSGSGPPLVMLHGGPGLWDYLDEPASMVDDLATVHRYDQRGGGRSSATTPYDVATFVADLDALRDHWDYERWLVGGHSWGADLATAYAARHPERVLGLLWMDGTGPIHDWGDEYHSTAAERRSEAETARLGELDALRRGDELAWTEELDREYCALTWSSNIAERDGAVERARAMWRAPGPAYDVNSAVVTDWRRMLGEEFVAEIRQIAVPALVIHGAADPRPPRLAKRLAGMLPNATLAVIAGAGHFPWIERPEAVRDTMRSFVAGIVGSE